MKAVTDVFTGKSINWYDEEAIIVEYIPNWLHITAKCFLAYSQLKSRSEK